MAEGMASKYPNKKYGLGTALFELGLAAPSPTGDLERFRPLLQKLADESGDVVYLGVRQRTEVLYLMRVSGDYPLRVHVGRVGDRLPVDGSYAGASLLSCLEDSAIENILGRRREEGRPGRPELHRLMQQTRDEGYCGGSDFAFEGVAGMAAPIPNRHGSPYLAVSISATSARLNSHRINSLKPALLRTAQDLGTLTSGP
jgi:DNA-binding IclR family transcriptional regulator